MRFSFVTLSLPSVSLVSFPSSSSSCPRSSLRTQWFCGVAVFWACQRSAPLASLLLTASWSFASVLPSFSLSDLQFSSSRVLGLGSLVTAGSVVLMCSMQFFPIGCLAI